MLKPEELLTVEEAAARIGVTASAIRTAAFQGHLPFVRNQGRILIETSTLTQYLAQLRPNGGKYAERVV